MPKKPRAKADAADIRQISFRLPEDYAQALQGRAETAEMSRHDMARRYVVQIMSEAEDRVLLTNTVGELKNRVDHLINDQIDAIETLLIWAGKLEPEAAKRWIDENYRSRL